MTNLFVDNLYVFFFVMIFVQTLWFVYSLVRKRSDVADIAWGVNGIIIGGLILYYRDFYFDKLSFVFILICIWGLRLSYHIFSRNKKISEDYRYAKWRQDWGKFYILRSFFQIFILQGILLYLILMPVWTLSSFSDSKIDIYLILGAIVWSIGFFFESVADKQLADFKKNLNNKGKIMKTGLWKFSRHPNYFGEVVMWWGIFICSINTPVAYFALIGPIVITFLILKVSGVSMLEKKYEGNSEFEEYKKNTSAFIPWFSKK